MNLIVLLFNDFETLDAFGPVEVLGQQRLTEKIDFVSLNGGTVFSSQRVPVATTKIDAIEPGTGSVLLIPGGIGTREEVENEKMLRAIQRLAAEARYVLSVCTGSVLLAKAGILDNREATSNKMEFDWATRQGPRVKWVRKARWVKDGSIYTSSGVSAGIDMALGFVADVYGTGAAETVARGIEYIWNRDKDADAFA